MEAARVDKSFGWMATTAGRDIPNPCLSFPDAVKSLARKYGTDVVIDESNHTVNFITKDEKLIHKLAIELDRLAGEYEV